MKQGNRASLKEIPRKTVKVEFPEYDTFYLLREMSGTERDLYEIGAVTETETKEKVRVKGKEQTKVVKGIKIERKYLRARLVSLCMVDDTGARIYADDEIQQLADEIPSSVIIKLYEAAQTLNGLDADPEEEAKNSEGDPSGDSTSSSPAT